MSGPSEDWFAPPSGPPAPPRQEAPLRGAAPAPSPYLPSGPSRPPAPPQPTGGYPPEPYYAPGWAAPVAAAPPPRRRPGRRLWVPLAGLAVVGLVVGAVLGGRFWLDRRPLGTVDAATSVLSTRLGTGHCVQTLPADGEVGRVTVVPCDEAHSAEVVGARTLSFTQWPGAAEVAADLALWCEMDTAQREAGFHAVVWAPSEKGWGQGDRTGLCLAALDEGRANGSFVAGDEVTTG
ncbi:hypothetical protein [Actinotalea sp.]|uniref:hypothetical protein n=1 Tax=Actinotalea sp. TaxID=1872145 RepID=UPI00356A440A